MTDTAMTTLVAEPLTATAWAPFGWLPVDDTDPTDGAHTLHYEWGDPHLNVIAHAADEIAHTERGLVCDMMYRHDTHTQALMSLNCDAVVAVAPAAVDFTKPGDLATIRAFVLHPLDVLVLDQGTWHWGPFPLGDEPVRLLNVQGRRYAEDNASVDLAATAGTVVDVLVS
jgi:ureidoglycolate hydrolase